MDLDPASELRHRERVHHKWDFANKRLHGQELTALFYGELASFSPDGTQIAFQFILRQQRHWKRAEQKLAGKEPSLRARGAALGRVGAERAGSSRRRARRHFQYQ